MQKFKATMYVRLSHSDENTEKESNSIVNQKKLIEDYVKRQNDINIVSVKVDDGYSGIIFERPAFKEMMEDIKAEKINCVIVKDLSRLGREYIETGRYLRNIFPTYGVRFIAINDDIDTFKESSSTQELSTSLKSIFNDTYCRDTSIKTRSALAIKRENGDFVGPTATYGYKKSKENKNKLVIDENTFEVVKEIFKLKIEGKSAEGIAKLLNEKGVLSPIEYKKTNGLVCSKNSKWSATTIIRILKNEIYIGNLIQNKQGTLNYKLKDVINKPKEEWVKVVNTHEAIIEKQDYDLVQKIMALDTRTSPNSDKVYLFSGILICGCCGSRMTRKTNRYKDKAYYYYYCPTGKKNNCYCDMIKEDELIKCIYQSIKSHIDNVLEVDKLMKSLNEDQIYKAKISKIEGQINYNQEKLKKSNNFKSTLYENMINGILSKSEYKLLKSKYDIEVNEIEKAVLILKDELEAVKENNQFNWINHFKKYDDIKDIDRKLVINLIQSIVITSKTKIKISFNYQLEHEENKSYVDNNLAKVV